MTDLLNGLIKNEFELKAIPINNGWLELDTIKDFEIYNNMNKNNILSKIICLENL